MPEATRRPSAEEIERLSDAVRRDPGSVAYVRLGEAYLQLGRPRDAVEVGSRGLKSDPNNVEARIMVSRAFAQLHQWKEAQAELLKVVKADKMNRAGFRLLGEVLMRRADYERALPVLQHAQNLEPADPSILAMLKRAREGRPLDPPPAIPIPQSPEPGGAPAASSHRATAMSPVAPVPPQPQPRMTAPRPAAAAPPPYPSAPPPSYSAPVPRPSAAMPSARTSRLPPPSRSDSLDDEPTNVADASYDIAAEMRGNPTMQDIPAEPARSAAPLGRMELERVSQPVQQPPSLQELPVRHSDGRERDEEAPHRTERHAPPPPEDPFAPLDDEPSIRSRLPLSARAAGPHAALPPPRAKRESAPPPAPEPERPRPRVLGEKPRDAAQGPLRQSAALGEGYLNDLLTGGLLDVPNVRAATAEPDYDISPGRRWGRSTKRMFIYLFVLLFLGTGGGVYWYLRSEEQRRAEVAKHLSEADRLLRNSSYEGLVAGSKEALAAVMRDRHSSRAMAKLAEVSALRLYLYRDLRAEEVDTAIGAATRSGGDKDDAGSTSLAVARASRALAVLDRIEDPVRVLADAAQQLDGAMARTPDEPLLAYLAGMIDLAAGRRKHAIAPIGRAVGGGLAVATVAQADLLLDEGAFADARALYDKGVTAGLPFAMLGRSLTRSERSVEAAEAVADLNVGLSADTGPRMAAWKALAFASAHYVLEDYETATKDLEGITGLIEPRFLARVALLRLALGQISDAARVRASMTWYSDAPETDPLVAVVDAELLLARGLPDAAIAAVAGLTGLRAERVRGRALLDLGKADQALAALDAAAEVAPDDRDVQIWRAAARYIAKRNERKAAGDELDKLGLSKKTKVARYAAAFALAAAGQDRDARGKLEQSLADVGPDQPNPLAYRSHVDLARYDLAAGDAAAAEKHLDAALAQNPGYLPAHSLSGRALLLLGDPAAALEHLVEVQQANAAAPADELAFAEAIIAAPAAGEPERNAARDALRRAKKAGAPVAELQRVVTLVDPALAKELGLPGAK